MPESQPYGVDTTLKLMGSAPFNSIPAAALALLVQGLLSLIERGLLPRVNRIQMSDVKLEN